MVAHYDKRSTRFSEFQKNGLVDRDGSATNKSISANWSQLITERLNLSFGGQYQKTTYEGSGFINSVTKSLNSTVSYDLNETISPFIQLSLTDFKPETGLNRGNKSQNILVGSKILIGPKWTFSPSVGVNKVISVGSGFVTNNKLEYINERSTFQTALSRSVSPSGVGAFQQSDQFSLGYSCALSDRSKLGTNYSKNKNKSTISSESTQFSASYSYTFSDQWDMRLLFENRNQKDTNQNVNGNVFGLTFNYNTPEF